MSDEALDARLRDVAVPRGLCARLAAIAGEAAVPQNSAQSSAADSSGDELAAFLRDVPVPPDLLGWLYALADGELPAGQPAASANARLIQALGASEMRELDQRLRDVPLPAGLLPRCKAVAGGLPTWRMKPLSAAAVVLLCASGYFALMAAIFAPKHDGVAPRALAHLASDAPSTQELRPMQLVAAPAYPAPRMLVEEAAPRTTPAFDADVLAQAATRADPAISLLEESQQVPHYLLPDPSERPTLFERQVWKNWDRKVHWEQLPGAVRDARDELPELERRPTGIARGMPPPPWPGFDWKFYLKFEEWPVVRLSGPQEARLAVSRVPLRVGSDSFELARRYLAEGELPPPKQIRKEEFLAAMDYQFPLPENGLLGLRTAAGSSPFGERGTFLLQIGVQGGSMPQPTRPPTRLVLAVDVSHSMTWGNRLALVQRALRQALRQLRPGDRVSLVTFNDEAQAQYEGATHEDVSRVLQILSWIRADGGTDLAGGLRSAYALLRPWRVQRVSDGDHADDEPAGPQARRQVVLFTDGGGLSAQTVSSLEAMLAVQRKEEGVQLTIIDLDVRGEDKPPLRRLAELGGGRVVPAATVDEVRAAVEEALTGQSQLLARDVQLEVAFNPIYVEAFRLLGHEAASSVAPAVLDGAAAQAALPPGVPFVARQAATALYEVKLRSVVQEPPGTGPDLFRDAVATAKLTWTTLDGARQSAAQPISQLQFAGTLGETPLSLQLAALAAETAEVLSDSRYAQGSSLSRVQEVARRVNEQLRSRDSYRELTELLDMAVRRPRGRSGPRTGSEQDSAPSGRGN